MTAIKIGTRRIKNVGNLKKIWRKSVNTRKWGTGNLKGANDEYCLLGAIACEDGINVYKNSAYMILNKKRIALSFAEILYINGIPKEDIEKVYECPRCSKTYSLDAMIPHMNDEHGIQFKEAIEVIDDLEYTGEIRDSLFDITSKFRFSTLNKIKSKILKKIKNKTPKKTTEKKVK